MLGSMWVEIWGVDVFCIGELTFSALYRQWMCTHLPSLWILVDVACIRISPSTSNASKRSSCTLGVCTPYNSISSDLGVYPRTRHSFRSLSKKGTGKQNVRFGSTFRNMSEIRHVFANNWWYFEILSDKHFKVYSESQRQRCSGILACRLRIGLIRAYHTRSGSGTSSRVHISLVPRGMKTIYSMSAVRIEPFSFARLRRILFVRIWHRAWAARCWVLKWVANKLYKAAPIWVSTT